MERVLMINMELRYRQHPLEGKASGNPPIDTTEQFNITNCEDKSVTHLTISHDPELGDGPQEAEEVGPPGEENIATVSADSDPEEQPENATQPQRDRQPPLTFTYNHLGVPEYQRLNSVVDTIHALQEMPPPITAGWLLPSYTPHNPWYPLHQPQLLITVPQPVWISQY